MKDGVAFKDSCISFTEVGCMTSAEKSPDAHVYVYIPVSLKDPILVATAARLEQFLEQTFLEQQEWHARVLYGHGVGISEPKC